MFEPPRHVKYTTCPTLLFKLDLFVQFKWLSAITTAFLHILDCICVKCVVDEYMQVIFCCACCCPDVTFSISIYYRVSEFSSYEIELRNRVTQNDVTLRVTNSKIFIETFLSSY